MNRICTALAREAGIAAEHIGIGVTALSRANLTQAAYYGQAFFALSVGFERSAKLAIAVHHAIENDGEFPTKGDFRGYGHKIDSLLDKVESIAGNYGLEEDYAKLPRTSIHRAIVQQLTDFAANKTRYYNLEVLSAASQKEDETAEQVDDPIASWHREVTLRVLNAHCPKPRLEALAARSSALGAAIGSYAVVFHTDEEGAPISSVTDLYLSLSLVEYAQKYVRMYVLQIARHIAVLMSELGNAGYKFAPEQVIPALSEFYGIFYRNDSVFKKNKTWSTVR
ncbi:hypothetical protein Poly30_28270 [Planctomycetes bacterium Poly30]|uniref:Uncharacterized protein n=1 Tax=Saltatorellus ferox TaxID=2528018 RepID=A0A518ET86_9BACT|nr:hypothetical protein Poly30_28270 [Planctomycetes bacterium Poly30]